MPRLVHPRNGEQVDAAIDAFGNRVRVAILGYLRESGPCTRGELATALDVVPQTVSKHLVGLFDAELIIATPPLSQVVNGARVRYSVAPEIVEDLYQALGVGLRLRPGS